MKSLSSLGGITVVTLVLLLLLLLVWFECRSLALVLLSASVARPLLEWTLKELVDRPRPRLGQLVAGSGASFPSGHVMAAVAIWGLLPPVIAVVSGRRSAWWWSVGISATIIAVVAFSRVYLGVHWLSDVVAALLLGALYLLGVECCWTGITGGRPARTSTPASTPSRWPGAHGRGDGPVFLWMGQRDTAGPAVCVKPTRECEEAVDVALLTPTTISGLAHVRDTGTVDPVFSSARDVPNPVAWRGLLVPDPGGLRAALRSRLGGALA